MKSTDCAVIVMIAVLVFTWFQPAASTVTRPSGLAVDGSHRLGQLEKEYRVIAHEVVAAVCVRRGYVSCASDGQRLSCQDVRGQTVQALTDIEGSVWEKFWRSRTSNDGYVVYQPKDAGRVFFMHRTDDGLMFWVVYDPKGRDLPEWLKAQGFSEVGSYNANFAYAGRIQDVQKRRDFWIWLQAREYRMKEFEKKHPSLATSVPKE